MKATPAALTTSKNIENFLKELKKSQEVKCVSLQSAALDLLALRVCEQDAQLEVFRGAQDDTLDSAGQQVRRNNTELEARVLVVLGERLVMENTVARMCKQEAALQQETLQLRRQLFDAEQAICSLQRMLLAEREERPPLPEHTRAQRAGKRTMARLYCAQ